MRLAIHNNQMQIVDHIDNRLPGSLKYSNENISLFLEGSAALFELEIDKYVKGSLHPRLEYITDSSYISFTYNKVHYLMNIRKITQKHMTMAIECENMNMEMLNEDSGPYKSEVAMTFVEYISALGLFTWTLLEMGVNEINTTKLILEFTDTKTVLERILELVADFNGEPEIITNMYPNGQLKNMVLNVYMAYDPKNPNKGVGSDRKDVRLTQGREVTDVTVTTDKENQFTAVRIKNKDGNYYVAKKNYITKDDVTGLNETYMMRNNNTMYAPIAMTMYPSVARRNNCDNWTVRELKTELEKDEDLYKYMYNALKTYMYPIKTYDVEFSGYHVFKNHNIMIGDTIYVSDKFFLDGLLFQARVSELYICPSDTTQNRVVLTSALQLRSKIQSSLSIRMNEMIKENTPYILNISTSDGVSFKEKTGTSTLIPTLIQGNTEITDVQFQYIIGEDIVAIDSSYTVHAEDLTTERLMIEVRALVKNVVVASQQVTFSNVNDGVSPILLTIDSSKGIVFKNGNIETILTAKLWKEDKEIDIEGLAFNYFWSKMDKDGIPDDDWNTLHANDGKRVTITNSDVYQKSVFTCSISSD